VQHPCILYNKIPGYIKEVGNFKTFKKELKSFVLYNSFYAKTFSFL